MIKPDARATWVVVPAEDNELCGRPCISISLPYPTSLYHYNLAYITATGNGRREKAILYQNHRYPHHEHLVAMILNVFIYTQYFNTSCRTGRLIMSRISALSLYHGRQS